MKKFETLKLSLKVGVPMAALLAGAIGLKLLSRSKTADTVTTAPTSSLVVPTSVGAAPALAGPNRATASIPNSLLGSTPNLARAVLAPPKFEFNREMTEFANLRAKVFLSPEEKSERKRLLANTGLLRALEPILKFPAPVGTELGQLQNQAIDLLLEAKAQGGQAAGEVMRSIIEDKTIENEQADPQERRMLAGIKAEILFQWSSQEPARASDMQRWLPGPVSQRIWENVRAAQTANFAESVVTAQGARETSEAGETAAH